MGRHSRGSADGTPPPPVPDPPTRHPYAPRSTDDTGTWDRRTYRVVDVGLPEEAPPAFPPGDGDGRPPLRSVPEYAAGASPFGSRDDRSSRYRAAGSELADPGPSRYDPPGYGESRYGGGDPQPRRRRHGATRADLYETPQPPRGEPSRPGPPHPEQSRRRHGATRADLYDSPEPPRLDAPRLDAPGLDAPRLDAPRLDATRLESPRAEPPRPEPASLEATGYERSRLEPPRPENRLEGSRLEPPEPPRYGATRVDLAESVGSTALAPRPAPDPDEVTDTGARRTRSTFRLAPDQATTEATELEDDEDDEDDYHHEPPLLLQWGIFVGQTLTGAVAGLGVWLGFYRLWSTWPFYAVPAVGVAAIGMLVLARTLRRRHGRDLDLLTAIVTFGIITVLTVLPAAFTLQSLG